MNPSRLLWFAYIGLGIVLTAFILANPNHFISVDSRYYLQSATNLLAGRGYVLHEQDQWSWNGTFPIGYSALMATLSGLTGLSVFVASKLVNYAAIGFSVYSWAKRLGVVRAFWPLSLWTLGEFLKITVYTWSETVFLVLLAEWVWCLNQFLRKPESIRAFRLLLIGYGLFLIRYIGGFAFGITGLLAVTTWLFPCWLQAQANPTLSRSTSLKFLVITVSGFAGMGVYFWMNHQLSGSFFGGERFISTEPAWELARMFSWAILNECLLIRDFVPTGTNQHAWIGLVIQFSLGTAAYLYFRRNRLPAIQLSTNTFLPVLFLLTALVYVLVLFSVRTVSPFSGPNLRLMAPSTYCVLMAGLLGVSDCPIHRQNHLRPYWLLLLLCSWLQLLPQNDLFQRISHVWNA